MKTTRWLIPFGMISVFSFLLLDILGKLLWPEYNPVTTYTSILFANEAPHVHLMRFFMNTYTVCFLVFSLGMSALSLRRYHIYVKIGFMVMLFTAVISAVGYGGYPISVALIFSKNDIIHVLVTVFILCAGIFSILMITIGFLTQEKLKKLGRICLIAFIAYTAFNLWHLCAILNGSVILGLIQRLTFYTFHAITAVLSWTCTFRKWGVSYR